MAADASQGPDLVRVGYGWPTRPQVLAGAELCICYADHHSADVMHVRYGVDPI